MKLINKKMATAISGILLMGTSGSASAGDISISIGYAIPGLFIGYSNHGYQHYSHKRIKHHYYRPYNYQGWSGYHHQYKNRHHRYAHPRQTYRGKHNYRRHNDRYSYYR